MKKDYDNEKKQVPEFELLLIDSNNKVAFDAEKDFLINLSTNKKIFKKPFIENNILKDGDNLSIKIYKIKKNESLGRGFILNIRGNFNSIEDIRIKIVEYLKKNIFFDKIYILQDDISKIISTGLYEKIYQVESALRKYITKFFVYNKGGDWWNTVVDGKIKEKAVRRNQNELDFGKYVENNIFLIDFNNLGDIIQTLSKPNITIDYVRDIIKNEDFNETDRQELKIKLDGEHKKLYIKLFKENNFQQDLEELVKIRNKIAHNNLFVLDDQEQGRVLSEKLISTIKKAGDELKIIDMDNMDGAFGKLITKDVFIDELKTSLRVKLNFVGLQYFIINILGGKGYSYQDIREMVQELEEGGYIEIYKYESEENEYPVAAIKLK